MFKLIYFQKRSTQSCYIIILHVYPVNSVVLALDSTASKIENLSYLLIPFFKHLHHVPTLTLWDDVFKSGLCKYCGRGKQIMCLYRNKYYFFRASNDLFKVTNGNTKNTQEIYLNFTADTRKTSMTRSCIQFWCFIC